MPPRRRIPSAVRREVAELAGHRCSYCRSPELVGIPMVVDHAIPLAAGGSSDFDNLCLACYRCNEFKGARIEAPDPLTGATISLFNPRMQAWSEHFAWSNDSLYIVGQTAYGRATVEALHVNNEWLVRARRIWIVAGVHPPLE